MQRSAFVLALLLIGGGMIGATMMNAPQPSEAFAQAAITTAPAAAAAPAAPGPAMPDNAGFYAGESSLSPSERAGREIWFKATAGNERFHTYVFQQRIGVLIDWYRVLQRQGARRPLLGLGHHQRPGVLQARQRRLPGEEPRETYGFDWCPGDDELLQVRRARRVSRPGLRLPGCPVDANDPHYGSKDQRQSACDLAFGTSTGALGFRKFPNPRFDKERWLKVNGSLASWDGYRGPLSNDPRLSDSKLNQLADGSIEPPFLIGTACGSCHIAFDPLNPPKDPARPAVGEHQGSAGQPVHAHLRDPHLGHGGHDTSRRRCSRTRGPGRPTPRPSRPTRSTTRARSTR